MGKIISAIAHFATTQIVAPATNALGPIGTVVVGAIVLNPIGLLGSMVVANAASKITLIEIKNRIKTMIDANKSKVDEAEALKKVLDRRFFDDKTLEFLLELGKQLRSNLQIVLKDQQQKIKNLKGITLMRGLNTKDYDQAE